MAKTVCYSVQVTTRAQQSGVTELPDGSLTVAVAGRGKASDTVLDTLADYWDAHQNTLRIVREVRSRRTVIAVHAN